MIKPRPVKAFAEDPITKMEIIRRIPPPFHEEPPNQGGGGGIPTRPTTLPPGWTFIWTNADIYYGGAMETFTTSIQFWTAVKVTNYLNPPYGIWVAPGDIPGNVWVPTQWSGAWVWDPHFSWVSGEWVGGSVWDPDGGDPTGGYWTQDGYWQDTYIWVVPYQRHYGEQPTFDIVRGGRIIPTTRLPYWAMGTADLQLYDRWMPPTVAPNIEEGPGWYVDNTVDPGSGFEDIFFGTVFGTTFYFAGNITTTTPIWERVI